MKTLSLSGALVLFSLAFSLQAFHLAGAAQEEAPSDVVPIEVKVYPAAPEPVSGTLIIEDLTEVQLVQVPLAKQFVLTDLWFLPHELYNSSFTPGDRVTLVEKYIRREDMLLNSTRGDFKKDPLMLRWSTGMVFHEGTSAWLTYDFMTDAHNLGLQLHYSGYFQELPPQRD